MLLSRASVCSLGLIFWNRHSGPILRSSPRLFNIGVSRGQYSYLFSSADIEVRSHRCISSLALESWLLSVRIRHVA